MRTTRKLLTNYIKFIKKKKQQDQNALLELKEQEKLLLKVSKTTGRTSNALRAMLSVLGHY